MVRPRLADAEFFFKTDRKQRLEDNLPRLETVLFQKDLGSLRDKTDRIQALAGFIAEKMGADVNKATRAGLLSKCDLMTNMVFEFTDTQGVMGMHYARHDGEDEEVAVALKEQYQPRFAGDALPSNPVASAVAIAEKWIRWQVSLVLVNILKGIKILSLYVVLPLVCYVLLLNKIYH